MLTFLSTKPIFQSFLGMGQTETIHNISITIWNFYTKVSLLCPRLKAIFHWRKGRALGIEHYIIFLQSHWLRRRPHRANQIAGNFSWFYFTQIENSLKGPYNLWDEIFTFCHVHLRRKKDQVDVLLFRACIIGRCI